MFWPDIIELKHFYLSPTGKMARRRLIRCVDRQWPEVKDEWIVGLGFATPYLRPFLGQNRVSAVMPAPQGVMHWPPEGPNLAALADEAELPFPDSSIDKLLVVHALEYSDQAQSMMREIWRVLAPCGKVLVIVPNRRGLWSHMEGTPLAYGHPFNMNQMLKLLRRSMFAPLYTGTALFTPPTQSKLLLRMERILEALGPHVLSPFGGVLVVEAEKQIYAVNAERAVAKKNIYIPAAKPVIPLR